MRTKSKFLWWSGFTALFAVLMGYVFWGTWSASVAPIMPDCPTVHPLDYGTRVSRWIAGWLHSGRFVPTDVATFLISPYVWQELQYAVGAYFAALGLAYFLRGRGLARLACYGAGLLLGFSGYWLTLFSAGHGSWFIWMTYGVFAFGLCDRAVRKGRWRHWIMLGAVLAWASFWQVDMWLLFTVFTGIYFVWCCVRERKMPAWCGLGAAAAVFFVIGTPSFADALTNALSSRDKQIAESKGSVLGGGDQVSDAESRWIFVTNWSMPPEDTFEFFIPRVHGDTSCPMTLAIGRQMGTGVRPYTGRLGRPVNASTGNYRQHSLYVGWVTCLLAVVGVVLGVRTQRRDVLFFAIAAFVFWIFSMGRFCAPVYRIVYALPFGDYLRAPVKWHHLTEFCLVVLAGYGLVGLRGVKFFQGHRGAVLLGVLVFWGACDLARVAHLYCAPVDLTVVKERNPAAEEVTRRGRGKVVDFIQRGQGPVAWSFTSHDVDVTGNPGEDGVRYVWAAIAQLQDATLSEWLKSKRAVEIGSYAVTPQSIRSAPRNMSNVVLLEMPGISVPLTQTPTPRLLAVALGLLSLFGTVSAAAFTICSHLKDRCSGPSVLSPPTVHG